MGLRVWLFWRVADNDWSLCEGRGLSVRRTVGLILIEGAGKMDGAFRRLEFSARAAKLLGSSGADGGCFGVP